MRGFKGATKRTWMLIVGLMAVGTILLLPGQPTASGADCGPTLEWSCAFPGCDECPETLFVGTVCEKEAYEAATGRVCSL